MTMLRLK